MVICHYWCELACLWQRGVNPIGATSKDLTIDFCESVPGIINIIKSYSNTNININIQNFKLVFQKIIYWRDNAMNRFQYCWWLYNNLLTIIMIVLQPLPHLLAPPSYLWKDSVRRTNRGWFFNCSPIQNQNEKKNLLSQRGAILHWMMW